MTIDVPETFYFKPKAGKVMVSPVYMEPSVPCDVQADELEVAVAIDRIQTFTTLDVKPFRTDGMACGPLHPIMSRSSARTQKMMILSGWPDKWVTACWPAPPLPA